MKKIVAFFMAIVVFVSAFSLVIQAESISTYNNHTIRTNTNFYISDTGLAEVYTCYDAYEDVMTEAVVTLTIKKRTLLLFWDEITTFTYSATDTRYYHIFERQLHETGTYKCEVEYVIYGTAGDPDVIPFEDLVTYG
ncbi:MAG: hypothetical protein IJ489_00925 [Clostridia bacterium]|nr:hypothetical protein [Clostridia bacterium]